MPYSMVQPIFDGISGSRRRLQRATRKWAILNIRVEAILVHEEMMVGNVSSYLSSISVLSFQNSLLPIPESRVMLSFV